MYLFFLLMLNQIFILIHEIDSKEEKSFKNVSLCATWLVLNEKDVAFKI